MQRSKQGGMSMKALLVAVSGFLAYMYLSAIFAASQRMPAHGGTTAQGSERMHATSSSKVEVAMARSTTTRVLLAQNKQLSDKLSALLRQQNPPVADLQAASQGFNMLSVFVTAVHISDNLSIPFDRLKTAAQTSGSLSKAIHMLKPDADLKAEVRQAMRQASEDLDKTPGVQLARNKQLSDKLSALLRQQNPPVADLQAASQGFNMLGVFVTAVHISDNLSIPFDQLKTAVQTSGDLWKAIHMLKPDADVKAEVWEAARQASDDLEESYRLIGQSSSPSI